MKTYFAITLAACLAAPTFAQVATTEKVVEKSTSIDGGVKTTTEHRTETNVQSDTAVVAPATVVVPSERVVVAPAPATYVTRLESAYKYAGIPQETIVKLQAIDNRVYAARKADPRVDLNTYYVEQQKILTPAQVTKVRTYLTEHPVAASAPAYEVTTYETVPKKAGVSVNTPLGSVGVSVPAGSTVIERKEVVPANP